MFVITRSYHNPFRLIDFSFREKATVAAKSNWQKSAQLDDMPMVEPAKGSASIAWLTQIVIHRAVKAAEGVYIVCSLSIRRSFSWMRHVYSISGAIRNKFQPFWERHLLGWYQRDKNGTPWQGNIHLGDSIPYYVDCHAAILIPDALLNIIERRSNTQ